MFMCLWSSARLKEYQATKNGIDNCFYTPKLLFSVRYEFGGKCHHAISTSSTTFLIAISLLRLVQFTQVLYPNKINVVMTRYFSLFEMFIRREFNRSWIQRKCPKIDFCAPVFCCCWCFLSQQAFNSIIIIMGKQREFVDRRKFRLINSKPIEILKNRLLKN